MFSADHFDPQDPAFHDAQGDKAVRAIYRRHAGWLSKQDEATQARLAGKGPLHRAGCPCYQQRTGGRL